MYKAIEFEREFRDKLVRNAKSFLMDIINKRISLGWEEPSEDGCYSVKPGEFHNDILRIKVLDGNTYDEEEMLEARIVTEIHLGDDIWLTCKADPELDDDDKYEEEIYLSSLPLGQMVNVVCALEDYSDEIPDAE